MYLRCKAGDLAVVIRETPACQTNIGRVVEVRGPPLVSSSFDLPTWKIQPISLEPYAVEYSDGLRLAPIHWSDRIEHPDAWLLPIGTVAPTISGLEVAAIPPVDWDRALSRMLREYEVFRTSNPSKDL